MKLIALLILLSAPSVYAAFSEAQDFDCTVKSFDAENIFFVCPTIKNSVVLDKKSFGPQTVRKLQAGQKIKVNLSLNQIAKFNAPPSAETK